MLPANHTGRSAVVVTGRGNSECVAAKTVRAMREFSRVEVVEGGIDVLQFATVYTRIDLVVIDGSLPGLSGLEVARAVHVMRPQTRIVLCTPRWEDDEIVVALRAGIDTVLPEDCDQVCLVRAIRGLLAGEPVVRELLKQRPAVMAQLVQLAANAGGDDRTDPLAVGISTRELSVMDGVLQGMSNREIADHLCLSEQTVKNHMTSLLRKLELGDRMQVLRHAAAQGWVRFDQPRKSQPVTSMVGKSRATASLRIAV